MEQDNQHIEHRLTKKEKRELRRQEKQEIREKTESKRTTKRVLTWISIFVVLGLVVFGMVKILSSVSDNGGGVMSFQIGDQDWIEGNSNATTTIVEYSDFQCPACARYYPLVKQLVSDLGSQIRVVYRNFPLPQHQNADVAARAAGAAGKQGKLWEMHDKLFENQNAWAEKGNAEEIFIGYANELGLNVNQFKTDINSKDIEKKIQDDLKSGLGAGVNSTPSFFINGVKIQNPRSYDEFKSIIEQSIRSAR